MKSWGVIGRSSLLKSCNNFNLNASMATCQAAPFIGTYETNTIGHYTGPFARWDLWDDGLVFPCHQSSNPLQHTGRGLVQGSADLARVNIGPLQERSRRSACVSTAIHWHVLDSYQIGARSLLAADRLCNRRE